MLLYNWTLTSLTDEALSLFITNKTFSTSLSKTLNCPLNRNQSRDTHSGFKHLAEGAITQTVWDAKNSAQRPAAPIVAFVIDH